MLSTGLALLIDNLAFQKYTAITEIGKQLSQVCAISMFKFIIEIAERYFLLAVLTIAAPSAVLNRHLTRMVRMIRMWKE